MIEITKYKTVDGFEYSFYFTAKKHEENLLLWLNEVKEKCVFMDEDYIPAEISSSDIDNLYNEIRVTFEVASYIRVKEELSFDAWDILGNLHKFGRIAVETIQKKGLYKLNNRGHWEYYND